MIKLFSDRSHYDAAHRNQLAELLRPYWKEEPFTDIQRQEMYGLAPDDFCLVGELAQADLAVLPLTWNYYLGRREIATAQKFITAARRAGRPVLSGVSGDEGVTVPAEFDDVFVVRASGYRSRRRKRQLAQPVFFDDPWRRYPEYETYERPAGAGAKPTVGFCGQASVGMLKPVVDVIRTFWRNCQYRLGQRLEEPQPLGSPARLRARSLQTLRASSRVQPEFIIRSKYRAGVADAASREKTTREFYANLADTDYTLCVRGGGNFSKRLYETLAMGRIPLLVDTDCVLPFEPELAWGDYIVRVDQAELATLADRVAEHFARLGAVGLAAQKHQGRELWVRDLTFGGFHRRLVRHVLKLA